MKRHFAFIQRIGLSTGLILLLAVGSAGAANIAWDMVNSSSYNRSSFATDSPGFTSPGDGFQKYAAVPQICPPAPSISENLNNIPFNLVDDSVCIYTPDTLGIIDSMTDFEEFFGVTDTVTDTLPPGSVIDNPDGLPLHATWVFDISAAIGNVVLSIDLAAMGNFEADDIFQWSYQVDGGPAVPIFAAIANEDGDQTYTMANPATPPVALDDPMVIAGTTLYDEFQTFSTPVPAGSTLTVVLTAVTNGSEGYIARNIMVTGDTDQGPGPGGGGLPVPDLSPAGIAFLSLLMVAGGVFLLRRRS